MSEKSEVHVTWRHHAFGRSEMPVAMLLTLAVLPVSSGRGEHIAARP